MKSNKKILCIFLMVVTLLSFCYSSDNSLLIQGLEAYRQKDWTTALFFLKKASTLPENMNAETWYVLIMSEVYATDFEGVLEDGNFFLYQFAESGYVPQVKYQMARSTFLLEDYNQAFAMFDDFCKTYPEHELYSSSLFWQAETLYQMYDYVESEKLFEQLVKSYPNSPKIIEAAFRLELLEQREKEEKLLYLLRVTGEENLAAKEDYERQIKQYQSEESINFKMKVTELTLLVESLQTELEESNTRIENLLFKVNELTTLNEELRLASESAKKAAAEASYEAELQRLAYEEELRMKKMQLAAEYAAKENLKKTDEVISEVKEEVIEEMQASIEGPDSEETYIPKDDVKMYVNSYDVDFELQELKKKAKELEELLLK